MAVDNETFYENLTGFPEFNQFTQLTWYTPLPEDWLVVITDVQESTRAVQEGKYRDVNSLGASSIVALLNAVKPVKIPFVFGGDGATACIPPSKKEEVESALVATKQMAEIGFGLQLRIGLVSMKTILENNHRILVGKYQPSEHYQQAMFQGTGLSNAETLVKSPASSNPYLIAENIPHPVVSFKGFECRWNEIPSPHEETITLLVQARDSDAFAKDRIYAEVMKKIIEIYGREDK